VQSGRWRNDAEEFWIVRGVRVDSRSRVFSDIGYWVFLGMKAASLFRLHEYEVWQGLYRLVVEVFWALGDATGRSGGVTGRSGDAT
jgi:hypothetical protein